MSRRNKRWPEIGWVALPSDWFFGRSPEFSELSVAARMVYFCLKSAYIRGPRKGDPGNNGKIAFAYSTLQKGSGFSSNSTISKAIQELERAGWIRRTTKGGLFEGANKYELTWKYDPLD